MRRTLAAALTLLALALLPAAAFAVPNQERHPLSVGHVDAVAPKLVDGSLTLEVHDDSVEPSVERDPADVLLHAKPESALAVPDAPGWEFLGAPGDTVYYLPQTQNPELVWPGWSSETIAPGVLRDDELTWRLLAVDGPGTFHLFGEGVFGDPIKHLSLDAGWPTAATMNAGTHAHYSWAFSQPGLYKIVFEVSATLADGTPVTSGPVEYRAFVGDLADLPSDTDLSIDGLADEYHPGDTVSLTAVQDPSLGLDHYHWYTRCDGSDEWSVVAGVASATWQFVAGAEHEGCDVQVRLFDANHEVVAASSPVQLHVHGEGAHETALSIAGVQPTYAPGDAVALTAVQDPITDLDHYHWFTRCAGAADRAIVAGASGAQWSFAATPAHDGCQVQARLYDHDHDVVAESAPVTLRVNAPQPGGPTGGSGGGGTPTPAPQEPQPVVDPAEPAPPAAVSAPSISLPAGQPRPSAKLPAGQPRPTAKLPAGQPRPTAKLPAGAAAPRRLARTGRARVACELSAAGMCTVRAWVRPGAARKLGLRVRPSAKRVVLASGRATRSSAGTVAVTVRLSKRTRAALRSADGPVRIHLAAAAKAR